VTYGDGAFIAVGFPSITTSYSTMLSSPDGVAWRERVPGSAKTLRGAVYGDGTFVVVGEQSTILQSARQAEFSLTVNGLGPAGFDLTVVSAPGNRYRVQASTNLNGAFWTDLGVFTNVGPTMPFTDTTAASFPARFYRLVTP